MVGGMVKLKCRLKLDYLKIKPKGTQAEGPQEEGKPEEVEGVDENVSGDKSEESELEVPGCSQKRTRFHCPQSDIVVKVEEEKDISGSIFELEQEEISIPKGPRKGKLPKSPDFPRNPHLVGGMVKLKCRLKLDYLKIKPKGAEAEGPQEEGKPEEGDGANNENVSGDKSEESELEVKSEESELEVKSEESELEVKSEESELEVKSEESELEVKSEESELEVKSEESELEVPGCSQKRTRFHCPQSDIVVKEEEEKDISGSILELEQEEISTPKGPRKGKLPKSPDLPRNPHWIKPEVLLEEMWEKKRPLRLPSDDADQFVFPDDPVVVLSPHVWELPDLMDLKIKLNATKSSIDHFPLDAWHSHTKGMNIANLIMSYVKRYFNPEYSSQAWGKMFEILCAFPDVMPRKVMDEVDAIINDEKRIKAGDQIPFDTVHLCEAPGAFVSALNHFLKISYSYIDWKWLATTLNPYHENNDVGKMINDDRLILMSLENWTFLEDKTGNILTKANMERLVKDKKKILDRARPLPESGIPQSHVLLVTADGSIDCQIRPGEQERMVAHLQYGEIITALQILQPGGSFILKIFTFLEAVTICHLYLLSCVFKEVHLFKPTTSKEGNSEVYVICIDFVGKESIDSILREKLIPNIEKYGTLLDEGKLLLPHSAIPKVFMDRIKEAAKFFCGYQMKIIRRNCSTFPCDTRIYSVMKPFRKEAAEQWIDWTEIKALSPKLRLFTGEADEFIFKASHLDLKREIGCFADKVIRYEGTDFQRLHAIQVELMTYDDWKGAQNHCVYGSAFKVGPIEFERPYRNIRCSRFCYGRILSAREEIREIISRYIPDLQAQGLGSMDNICSGHAAKRVYESMSKNCDVVSNDMRTMEVLCFNKLTWDYVTKNDFQQQKEDLTRLIKAVQEMGRERSMFLCRFPMLTRLQTGLIFCLASVFEKVILYGDPAKNVVGILLHKFKGLIQPSEKNMFRSFGDVLDVLVDDEFNWPVLQIVPMKTLLEFLPSEFLVRYNMLLLCQDMLRTINVVSCMIEMSGADRRASGMKGARF